MGLFTSLIGGLMCPLALTIGGAFRVLGARLLEIGAPSGNTDLAIRNKEHIFVWFSRFPI
jgi:hypothetical protein